MSTGAEHLLSDWLFSEYFFLSSSAEDSIQGFTHAKQVLYNQATPQAWLIFS
jgi:hypothetical protein